MKDCTVFSPDLNHIENVWGIIKMELEKKDLERKMNKLKQLERLTIKFQKILYSFSWIFLEKNDKMYSKRCR